MAAEQGMAAKGAALRAVAAAMGHDVANKLAGAPGLTDAELGGATDNPLNELIAAGNPAQAAQDALVAQAVAAIVPAAQQGVQQQLQQLQVGLQQQLQQLQVGLQQQLQQQLQEGQQQLQQQLQAQGVGLFNTIARTYNRRTLVTDQLMPLRMEVPAAGAEGAGDFGDLPDAGVFPQTWDDTSGWGHARLDAVAAFYQQDFAAGATVPERKAALRNYLTQF